MSEELKPCAFCGGVEIEYGNCDRGTGQWYDCIKCGIKLMVGYGEDLKKAWNTRPESQKNQITIGVQGMSETKRENEQVNEYQGSESKIDCLKMINDNEELGQLLMMAIARLTCTTDSSKTPDDVIRILQDQRNQVYRDVTPPTNTEEEGR